MPPVAHFQSPPHFFVYLTLFVYFLPTVVATLRRHTHALSVFAVNLLLGWTIVGWVVSQIWAFTNDPVGIKANWSTKILATLTIFYYVALLVFMVLSAAHVISITKGRPPATEPAHAAQQTSPPPQNSGIPEPASKLFGK